MEHFYYCTGPAWKLFLILTEQPTIDCTQKKLWCFILYRIVIQICPIHKLDCLGGIAERLIIA